MKAILLLGLLAQLAGASNPEPSATLTTTEVTAIGAAVRGCTGGYYDDRVHDAKEIIGSLPKANEPASLLSERRASDTYRIAGALLKPALPNPERAADPSSALTCTPDPALGVRLMKFLAAGGPAAVAGPVNSYYWLGLAYRRGVGAPRDIAQSRTYYLYYAMLASFGHSAEDWGEKPTDELLDILGRPAKLPILEAAAAAGQPHAQLLLGRMLVATQPDRARTLIQKAVDQRDYFATLELADLERKGAFGRPDPERAVRVLAPRAFHGSAAYTGMIEAAVAFNAAGPEILAADKPATIAEIGGMELVSKREGIALDAMGGAVRTRGLVAPDGSIVFTEVIDARMRGTHVGNATLQLFAPGRLTRLPPMIRDGRAVFHWVTLPTLVWLISGTSDAKGMGYKARVLVDPCPRRDAAGPAGSGGKVAPRVLELLCE